MTMRYWLMKSEPDVYGIHDLKEDGKTHWDGIRNYQARNFMRDDMQIGDKVLFYHSNAKPPGVAGTARVCSRPYPDHTAWDPSSPYFSDKSTPENPVWIMVDVEFESQLPELISLDDIRGIDACNDMLLLKKGQRLSIQPIEKRHFDSIIKFSKKRSR